MPDTHTAFASGRKLGSGPLSAIAPAVKTAFDAGESHLLIFNDTSGRQVDLDLRGPLDQVLARLAAPADGSPRPQGRGRPKLGVTPREVTLLPS